MLDLKHGQESGERLYGGERRSSSELPPAAHEGRYAIAQTFAAFPPMLRVVRIDLRSVDLLKGTAMDRALPIGGSFADGGSHSNPMSARVEDAARAAHEATDKVADKATAQVDRVSGTAHRAVNTAADAAASAAKWVSAVPASIRARPITVVAGALVIGYLLGRLARR